MAEPLAAGDPTTLGSYRLLGRLGTGGQGVVYLGQSPEGTQVAIKTLSGEGTADPRFRERFVREAEAAQQVASFCTAAVLDVDFTTDPPYIVSEYVDGPSLQAAVTERGPLTGGELHRMAVATATALMAMHEAGIVHRDLKPANVLLGSGGARVIDFGVARVSAGSHTQTNSSIGTPTFMAPEQIAGDPVDGRTDVFAWAAVLVFAATGRTPFSGDTVPTILHQVLNAPPDLAGVPEPLHGLAATALRKNPVERPSSTDVLMTLIGRNERPGSPVAATQVLQEAAATVQQPAQPAGPTSGPPSSAPKRSRGRLLAVAAGAFALGLLAGFGLGWTLLPDGDGQSVAHGSAEDEDSAAEATEPDAAGGAGDENDGNGEDDPDSEPDAQAEADDEAEPLPDLDTPDELARFTEEFDDDWLGHTAGQEWEAEFSEDERTAAVEAQDSECEYHLLLHQSTDQGYVAEVDPSGEDCESYEAVELHLDGDMLTMQFYEPSATGPEDGEPVHFERD